ncbi:nucleoside recognition domain-containing protein [Halanaerobaculum tunisiense]
MEWSSLLTEIVSGSFDMLKKVALIIFPLLIGIEIADEKGVLNKVSALFKPILKHFKLSKNAALPLIAAQMFGLLYGAGIILREVEDDKLHSQDLMPLSIFLVICHAVIEDTLLFASIGGNVFIILGMRVVLAIIITYFYSKYFVTKEEVNVEDLTEIDCC